MKILDGKDTQEHKDLTRTKWVPEMSQRTKTSTQQSESIAKVILLLLKINISLRKTNHS